MSDDLDAQASTDGRPAAAWRGRAAAWSGRASAWSSRASAWRGRVSAWRGRAAAWSGRASAWSGRAAAWSGRAAAWQRRSANSLAGRTWRRGVALGLPTQSLALAAQQILCTTPLLVAFSAAHGNDRGQSVGTVLTRYLALSPAASADVGALFNDSQSVSTHDRLVGLVLALLFATAIAATQQRWFELVWTQPRAGVLRSVLRQVLWVAGLCGYLVVVLYAGRAGHGFGRRVHAARPAGLVVQFGVSFLFFWWSQRLLLAGRVGWRRLIPGAMCMALGMTVLVGLSGYVMSGEIVGEVADYGLIGSTFVLSVWLVGLSGVLCAGALLGEQIKQRQSARARPATSS